MAGLLTDIPSERSTTAEVEEPAKTTDFKKRDELAEKSILFDLFTSGVDMEDMRYFRKSYDKLLNKEDTVSQDYTYNCSIVNQWLFYQ